MSGPRKRRTHFGVAYYRRTYPKLQRAKQLLEAGVIGKPVFAELTCHSWFDGKDRRKGSGRSWLLDPAKAGGGPLFDIASHRIDVLNFLFGQPACHGHLSNAVHQYAVEDNATAMIDYAGGVRGIVDVRWHSKIKRDECRIRGTRGNGVESAERARVGLSRRTREFAAALEPALSDDRKFCGCGAGQSSAAGQRSFFLLDRLGHGARPKKKKKNGTPERQSAAQEWRHPPKPRA